VCMDLLDLYINLWFFLNFLGELYMDLASRNEWICCMFIMSFYGSFYMDHRYI
jgi:hypothetical protein